MTVLQLQFWDPNAKCYFSAEGETVDDSDRNAIQLLADRARRICKAWRIAKLDRPISNPKHRPPRYNSQRQVKDIQRDYLLWARSKGLTSIVAYENKRIPKSSALFAYKGTIRYITLEEHFNVEESTELEQAA